MIILLRIYPTSFLIIQVSSHDVEKVGEKLVDYIVMFLPPTGLLCFMIYKALSCVHFALLKVKVESKIHNFPI